MPKPRIYFWDIETSHLSADFGVILSSAIGHGISGRIEVFKSNQIDDKDVVIETSRRLEECDVVVTWYGKRFDERFLATRAIKWGLKPPHIKAHFDGWETSRSRLALHSNRLASVSEFLLSGKKTPLLPDQWVGAIFGDKEALQYVYTHNIRDITVLRRTVLKMLPVCYSFPPTLKSPFDGCYFCGSRHLSIDNVFKRRSGTFFTKACMRCGLTTKERGKYEEAVHFLQEMAKYDGGKLFEKERDIKKKG